MHENTFSPRVFGVITFAMITVGRSMAMIPDYSKGKMAALRIIRLHKRQSQINPQDDSGIVLVRIWVDCCICLRRRPLSPQCLERCYWQHWISWYSISISKSANSTYSSRLFFGMSIRRYDCTCWPIWQRKVNYNWPIRTLLRSNKRQNFTRWSWYKNSQSSMASINYGPCTARTSLV